MTFNSANDIEEEITESQPLLRFEKSLNIKEELRLILFNAFPLTLTFLLQGLNSSMPLLFVGRLGALELGGVAIANVTFTVSVAVFIGLSTSLDTLCPQAYGAGQYKLVGLYFQRCVMLALLIAIPMIIMWINAAKILKWFVDEIEIVKVAASYLRVVSFSLPGYIIFECGKRYFQSMNNYTRGQYILFMCAPFNFILNILLIFHFQFGYIGACYALIITYNMMGLMMIVSIYMNHIHAQRHHPNLDCWHKFSRRVFEDWGTMVRLSVPGIIMVESEFFAFEFTSILAAKFGATILAAQSIASTVESIAFQIPFSVSVAASNRIAFQIGQGDIEKCKMVIKYTLIYIGSALSLFNFLVLFLGRYGISKVFTNDPLVIRSSAQLLIIIGVNQFWDVFNIFGAACLRAQGRQRIGGYFSLFAYYIVGLPAAVFFGFKLQLAACGFWIGIGLGVFFLACTELICIYKSNWSSILKKVKQMHSKV